MIGLTLIKNKTFKLKDNKLKKLSKNDCRIEIISSGICASDIPRAFENMAYKYPLILGHEFMGKVVNIGSNVTKFSVGDLVSAFPLIPCSILNKQNHCTYCNKEKYNLCDDYSYYGSRKNGSFTELMDVNEWNLFKISDRLPKNHGAIMEPVAVSFNIINAIKDHLNSKQKILIIGSGFLGQVLCRILKKKSKNFEIFSLDRNDFKLKLNKKYNDETFLFKRKSNNNLLKKYLDKKFDIVIETSGHNMNFYNAITFAKKEGLIIYSGNINDTLVFKKEETSNILRKQLKLKGVWNSSFKSKVDNWKEAHAFLMKNDLSDLITHQVDLEKGSLLMNDIYNMKKGKKKNIYLKGIITSK